MIKTIVFFTAGGVFSGLGSRRLMNLPLLYKPQLLALTTSAGFGIGYFLHSTEERFWTWYDKHYAYEMPDNAPLWVQKQIKEKLDHVDLLQMINRELPEEVGVKLPWEKRFDGRATSPNTLSDQVIMDSQNIETIKSI